MRGGPQVEGAIASTDMFGLPADSYLSAPENKHVVLRNTATQTVGFPLDQERSRWQLALMKLRNALAVSQVLILMCEIAYSNIEIYFKILSLEELKRFPIFFK